MPEVPPQSPDETENQAPAPQPVTSWKRDENGLLPFVKYAYNADGSINWRKMIKPEFLVVNKQAFERRKQDVPKSIEGVDDKDLLILLGGIKDLARLRGYTFVQHTPIVTSPNYCSVRTTINWTPNFETDGESITFDSLADASTQNTNGFAKLYLAAIAENRGFVRAVRNFLGINIAGQDEVGADYVEEEPTDSNGNPHKFLEGILTRNSIKFESFKNRMVQKKVDGAEKWETLKDVPSNQVWEVASLVQQILDAKKQAQS